MQKPKALGIPLCVKTQYSEWATSWAEVYWRHGAWTLVRCFLVYALSLRFGTRLLELNRRIIYVGILLYAPSAIYNPDLLRLERCKSTLKLTGKTRYLDCNEPPGYIAISPTPPLIWGPLGFAFSISEIPVTANLAGHYFECSPNSTGDVIMFIVHSILQSVNVLLMKDKSQPNYKCARLVRVPNHSVVFNYSLASNTLTVTTYELVEHA